MLPIEASENIKSVKFGRLIPDKEINQSVFQLEGAVGSADLKISKSPLLSLNHHNFLNTKPIYAE